jgi:hypothetical protein
VGRNIWNVQLLVAVFCRTRSISCLSRINLKWYLPSNNFLLIEPVKWQPQVITFDAGDYIIFRQDMIQDNVLIRLTALGVFAAKLDQLILFQVIMSK